VLVRNQNRDLQIGCPTSIQKHHTSQTSEVCKYIDIFDSYWSVFIQVTFTKVNEVPGQCCRTILLAVLQTLYCGHMTFLHVFNRWTGFDLRKPKMSLNKFKCCSCADNAHLSTILVGAALIHILFFVSKGFFVKRLIVKAHLLCLHFFLRTRFC
jgi:hypothetical protein